MGRTLYLQCDAGISGDMVVGALLDAGANEAGLLDALDSMKLEGYTIAITRKEVGALVGCDFDVKMDEAHQNHDHDMGWLYGDESLEHGHGHHEHGHGHHEHGHGHHEHCHGHHGHHEHRNLADVTRIIERADLPQAVVEMACKVFGIIADAEAKAHGATRDTVHFHEVGAVDSIVDVVAAAWCLNDLNIDDVVVSPLAEGEGHIRSAHGILPIPVPAVAHIVEAYGLTIKRAHRMGELVTPTGAALAAAFQTGSRLPETYRIVGNGLGCGKRAYDPPSTVRATIFQDAEEQVIDNGISLWKLETEVDDCTGEALGYVLDRLYEANAREAHFVPVFMKKGRPGYQIEVLCEGQHVRQIEAVLFENTTTIGIRRHKVKRTVLDRREVTKTIPNATLSYKEVVLPNGSRRVYPEHDSVERLALERGLSYQDALREFMACAGGA